MDIDVKDKTILVVAAHPDDAEFGCGATTAKFIKMGAKAYYVVCTDGNRGSRHNQFENKKLVRERLKEQKNAADVIGASDIFFLNHEDGNLVADLTFKEELVRVIRKLKPDMVFTHDPSWFYTTDLEENFINHNDHRETGIGVLDAVYPLARDLASFPNHSEEGLTPHIVKQVFLWGFENLNYFVDVKETMETKIQGILAHKSQVDDPEEVRDWVTKRFKENGKKAGVKFAEGFIRLQLK